MVSHIFLIMRFFWIIIFATDCITYMHTPTQMRLMKGKVRRYLIRRLGPSGIGMTRAAWWLSLGMSALILWIAGSHGIALKLVYLYWLGIGLANLIDFITSWDDPPWRRVRRYASDRVKKLLQQMGERSRVPQPAYLP